VITNNTDILKISPVQAVDYLGVIIDSNLKWNCHISKLSSKLRSLLSLFKFYKQIINIRHLKIVYFALVESQLRYGGAYNNNLNPIVTLQRWILKIMYGKERLFPTEQLFQLSQVLNIKQLYSLTVLITQKNNKNKNFTKNKYPTRGQKLAIQLPQISKTLTLRSHIYFGPRLFNTLPLEFRQLNSKNLYKKKVKQWLLANPEIMHKFLS
jgi:hypothetical protein